MKYFIENLETNEWLTMIRKYLNDAENGAFNEENDSTMEAIRKVTALGIAAIENIGCESRNIKKNDIKEN